MRSGVGFSLVLFLVLFLSSFSAAASTTGNLLSGTWTNPSAPTTEGFRFFENAIKDDRFCEDANTLFAPYCPSVVSRGQDFEDNNIFVNLLNNITSYTFGCYVDACTVQDGYSILVSFENSNNQVLAQRSTGDIYIKCDSSSDNLCVPRCIGSGSASRQVFVTVSTLGTQNKLPSNIHHVNFKISGYNAPYRFFDVGNSDSTDTAISLTSCFFRVNLANAPVSSTNNGLNYIASWRNTMSNETAVSSAQSGDTVFALVQNTNSTTLNYSLYRNKVYNNSQIISPKFSTGSFVNISYVSYVLNPTALTNYTFNVSNINKNKYNFSTNLTVNLTAWDEGVDISNTLPVAQIDSPNENFNNFTTNTLIWFNQSSTDEDDLLNLTWDFGDGFSVTFENYSAFEKSYNSSLGNVQHSYSQSGDYIVTLTAKEKNRAQNVSTTTLVSIYEPGIIVVPVITSPANGISVGSRLVLFNASQTYVLNCSTGTMDSPIFTTNDDLRCGYLHAPGYRVGQNLEGYSLLFNWTLDDGTRLGYWNSSSYSGPNGNVEFMHKYNREGVHRVKLKVTYAKT